MYTNLLQKVLLVPIRLDALLLQTPTNVADAIANFSLLPYSDGQRDYNAEIAYISEDIVSKPFLNQNTTLAPGIHLHWTLPDALTHAPDSGLQFPLVPDRWLISRKTQQQVDKRWIVESNFLHPQNSDLNVKSNTVIPLQQNSCIPFRFMGRNIEYSAWLEENAAHDYWSALTAIGYGDPTFSALYSNCPSVFGFFDPDYTANTVPDSLQYEIIGWYSNINDDFLYKFFQQWQQTADNSVASFKEQLQNACSWTYTQQEIPQQMSCYTQLSISPQPSVPQDNSVEIAVGNTISEALSALLANKLSPQNAVMIEEQLESIQLSPKIEQQFLDVGAKFTEARHEKSFHARNSGTTWIVKYLGQSSNDDTQVTLPSSIAGLLNELNVLQEQYDALNEQINDWRLRLFTDWYKYMICTHPPQHQLDYPQSDEVKFFIETVDFTSLDKTQDLKGNISIEYTTENNAANFAADTNNNTVIAYQLADKGNELLAALAQYNSDLSQEYNLVLKQGQAPRYWQANEPVLLFCGSDVTQQRHGLDDQLLCHCTVLEQNTLPQQLSEIEQFIATFPAEDQGFYTYTQPPWNPLLLEWKVEFTPAQLGRDLTQGSYQTTYINDNYTLPQQQPDFEAKTTTNYQREANIYEGRSILTQQTGDNLRSSLVKYLEVTVLPAYYAQQQIPQDQQTSQYLSIHIDDIIAWYIDPQNNNTCDYTNPVYTTLYAYQQLLNLQYAAQALSGFNDALIMLRKTLQLAIDDPLAFNETTTFIQAVADRVQNQRKNAPQPQVDFNPIRAGALQLLDLNFIDTFGQVRNLSWSNFYCAATLPSDQHNNITLKPRLSQPTRLNIRWLSAADDTEEMNTHPATTPICGWLLPNYLDNNLMVYDNNGFSLGAITMNTARMWQPNPGDTNPKSVEQITNPHLQNLVGYIIQQGSDYLQTFLDNVENALNNIDPEIYAQHMGLAILIGRPIAVTRLKLDLQICGLPACNQQWTAFRQDLTKATRSTYDFEDVAVPVRIGEHQQLNDGVVGYWIEDEDTQVQDILYLPQSDVQGNDKIVSYHDNPLNLTVTAQQPPLYLTVLFDPRGKLHATSGILPTKVIDIPADQFSQAFQNIDLSFLTAPIISGETLRVPLPSQPGFRWSWAQIQANGYWDEVSTTGSVHKEQVQAQWANGTQVWDTLLSVGWIQLTAQDYSNEAIIVPIDQRPSDDLGELNDQKESINAFLQSLYLQTEALYTLISQKQSIVEGWLKLRRVDTP